MDNDLTPYQVQILEAFRKSFNLLHETRCISDPERPQRIKADASGICLDTYPHQMTVEEARHFFTQGLEMCHRVDAFHEWLKSDPDIGKYKSVLPDAD